MKNILITGVNGFIGGAIAKKLKSKYNIFGIGREKDSYIDSECYYNYVDISDINQIRAYAKNYQIDHIVHCAAAITDESKPLFDSNIIGIWNIYQLAKMVNCKSIIYISSLPIIGIPKNHPIKENHPIDPQTNYHLSKYVGELLLQSQNDIPVYIFRITSPIGKGMPKKTILSTYIKNCLAEKPVYVYGEGTRRQDYVDVDDIALAVSLAIDDNNRNPGIYNIASSVSLSNEELAFNCKSILRANSDIEHIGKDPLDDIIWDVSIEKATQNIGYQPKKSIIQSVKEIASSYEDSDLQ